MQVTVAQTVDPVATAGQVHVVRHDHEARAERARQVEHQVVHTTGGVVVQIAGRLIGQ